MNNNNLTPTTTSTSTIDEIKMLEEPLNISEYYEGVSVLITGASGFLGKVLLEKLVFSQPKLNKIYLLLRPLNGEAPHLRLSKILESPLFSRIRCKDENRLERMLVPICGDLMQEDLGLSCEDQETLANEVSIVFHCAATVKFDEALRASIQMNVIGTQRLTALCRRMKQLRAFVHTSTAYANCNKEYTSEHIYEPCVNASKLVEAASSWMNEKMLDSLSAQLLDNRPNTYTFAKALAESQLLEQQKQFPSLPIIIIRPSIVGAIWKEPLPGWIDNVNGPTGIFIGVGKGLLTDMCGNVDIKTDIIPVDIVANMLIAAAVYRAKMPDKKENNEKTTTIPIIHCTSGELNPLKWRRIVNYLEQFFHAYPFDQCYRVPSTQFHRQRKIFLINFYLKHYLIAQAADRAFKLVGKRPKFVKIYNKIWRMMETLHYFTTREWTFESKNAVKLWNGMSVEDKKLYNFDIRMDWDTYLFNYLMGIKIYMLKERLENLPKAQAALSWLRQFNFYSTGLCFALILRFTIWRRQKRHKWIPWFTGFFLSYFYQNYNILRRPSADLIPLEEYKRQSIPHYLEKFS
uniref:Fatty acyl-CoA reductase n=1 Tax=Meloidogyne enterolobii TaxID=390850 RepID=A0A6V7TX58_MELEN|nr:unnamed protein product [Meloidogyne enterolobii]